MDLQSYNEKEAEFENKEYGGFHHPNNHTSENLNFSLKALSLQWLLKHLPCLVVKQSSIWNIPLEGWQKKNRQSSGMKT